MHADYKNMEVIIVDDGSTDNSYGICERLRQRDDRIVLHRKENGGVASARNQGVSMASGNYLCFCDQDDTVDRTCYAEQVRRLESDQSDICMCSVGQRIHGRISAFELSDDACYEGARSLGRSCTPSCLTGMMCLSGWEGGGGIPRSGRACSAGASGRNTISDSAHM